MIYIDSINKIVNKKYNTDKGWLYLVDLIRERFPYLQINEENLVNLQIVPLSEEKFKETGFVGEYVASKNQLRILEKVSDFDVIFTEEEILETFLHELVHALTSKYLPEEDMILEGFNMRRVSDKTSSFFIGLNEGVTQFIVNYLLNKKSNAYSFETQIASQLSLVLGMEELISSYFKNNIESLMQKIESIDKLFDFRKFIMDLYAMHLVLRGVVSNDDRSRATNIEKSMLDLYLKTSRENDQQFWESIITVEMAEDIVNPREIVQYGVKWDINEMGFSGISEVKEIASSVLDWRKR